MTSRTVTLAQISAVLALVAGCSGSTPAPSPTQPTGPTPRLVLTDSAEPSGMQARAEGELRRDASGCVQLDDGTRVLTPAWPRGYQARATAAGFEVLDAGGSVVAVSGRSVGVSGGGVAPVPSNWTDVACATGHKVWAVGTVTPSP